MQDLEKENRRNREDKGTRMKFNIDITYEYVVSVLDYNAGTGNITWKISPEYHNKKGKIAGRKSYGYIQIGIDYKKYMAHRLAWLIMTGKWPKEQIDHKNGNRSDNRWCNLREATHTENQLNTDLYKNNTSGYKGVVWSKKACKWQVQIRDNNKSKWLGYYDDETAAAKVYNEAAIKYHGEFARLNEIKG